jgi:4-hydroxybenzoate polyprenyltransferase
MRARRPSRDRGHLPFLARAEGEMYAPRVVAAHKPANRGHLVALPAPGDEAAPPAPSDAPAPLVVTDPPPSLGSGDPSVIQAIPILPASPSGSVLWRVRGVVQTLRPHQWVKNLFVLAPVVFAKELTSKELIKEAAFAFAVFCMLAGAVYTLNDIVDVEADRVHPVKRRRPIASGCVPLPFAKVMAIVLAAGALAAAFVGPREFFYVAAGYYVLNLAYSFRLKKIAYVDVGCIAGMFVLRVLAGGFATHTPISRYMIACTALLALFLGFGKRRHELAGLNAAKQRAALEAYSPRALTIALAVTGVGAVLNYLAYTLDKDTERFFETPWLWVTTIHTVFGVARFLQLVAGRPKAESPTQEMLRDVPFVLNLVLWVVEVIAFVYHVRLSAS